ncbi:stage V sporulation protein AB [Oceanobacillus sp. CAU 1775]
MILNNLFQIFIGFSGGIVVGGGFVAFITVLNIIPRLTQLTKTYHLINLYSASIVLGLLFGTILSFFPVTFNQSIFVLLLWGTIHGIFNGMLAAALTEVLNVFPILYKRVGLDHFILWLLMAIVFGKIFGSLFQWLYFVNY